LDKARPAVDLKLLINSVSGKQTILYPKGERISPVDFVSVLTGNPNRYPFDRYTSDIDLLVTAPVPPAPRSARPARPAPPPPPVVAPAPVAAPPAAAQPAPSGGRKSLGERAQSLVSKSAADSAPQVAPAPAPAPAEVAAAAISTGLVVGESDLNKSEPVPINETVVASLTGVKFDGQVTEDDTYKLARTSLVVRRANNVISVSIMIMVVMFILAISIMVMGLRVAASPDEFNLLPLSLCISLIFGLPALRAAQPGVPGVGALGDYLSFIWAEFIVTSAAIGLAWTWILRSIRAQRQRAQER
jgi:hypothetical protein